MTLQLRLSPHRVYQESSPVYKPIRMTEIQVAGRSFLLAHYVFAVEHTTTIRRVDARLEPGYQNLGDILRSIKTNEQAFVVV